MAHARLCRPEPARLCLRRCILSLRDRHRPSFALLQELGTASGFDLELVDDTGIGHQKLLAARNMMLGMAAQDHTLAGVRPTPSPVVRIVGSSRIASPFVLLSDPCDDRDERGAKETHG